jgi:hypothetical protein
MLKPMEEWRPVVGFEEFYQVSDAGQVQSLDRKVRRRHGLATLGGKVLRPWTINTGRLCVSLFGEGGRQRRALVHHLVLEAFVGPCPPGQEGCHGNGDFTDNHVANLRWDTPKGNHADKRRHGTIYQLNIKNCPQGHPYEHPNLVPSALRNGNRACLACSRAKAQWKKRLKRRNVTGTFAELADEYYRQIIS